MRPLLLLMLLAGPPAIAGDPDEPADPTTLQMAAEDARIPGVPPGAPPPPDQVQALAREIASELRCPVCQGLSVADSTSSAAVLMNKRVQELVAQGYTREEIDQYFISKYGEWVLLAPTSEGMNKVVWIGPAIAAALGLLLSLTFLRGESGAKPAGAASEGEAHGSTPPVPTEEDPYARRILAEVDDD